VSVRPDLIECWVFRLRAGGRDPEFLLIRRAPDRIFPGIWQPVTGGLHAGERAPVAARREVAEETGLADDAVEAMFDLDQVGSFYAEDLDAVVNSVIYAVRVRADAEASLSGEHDGLEWVDAESAIRRSIWPPYRESIERILRLVAEPDWARWFELDREGHRTAR